MCTSLWLRHKDRYTDCLPNGVGACTTIAAVHCIVAGADLHQKSDNTHSWSCNWLLAVLPTWWGVFLLSNISALLSVNFVGMNAQQNIRCHVQKYLMHGSVRKQKLSLSTSQFQQIAT